MEGDSVGADEGEQDGVEDGSSEGIEDGSIRKDLDPGITAILLWGHTMGILQLISSKGEMINAKTGVNPDVLLNHSLDFNYSALEP